MPTESERTQSQSAHKERERERERESERKKKEKERKSERERERAHTKLQCTQSLSAHSARVPTVPECRAPAAYKAWSEHQALEIDSEEWSLGLVQKFPIGEALILLHREPEAWEIDKDKIKSLGDYLRGHQRPESLMQWETKAPKIGL
eukprot:1160814-Pelagomonas_calceolata.AAC.3